MGGRRGGRRPSSPASGNYLSAVGECHHCRTVRHDRRLRSSAGRAVLGARRTRRRQGATVVRSFTRVTPGADQAARSISARSARERT
jgi:hypothetical protein